MQPGRRYTHVFFYIIACGGLTHHAIGALFESKCRVRVFLYFSYFASQVTAAATTSESAEPTNHQDVDTINRLLKQAMHVEDDAGQGEDEGMDDGYDEDGYGRDSDLMMDGAGGSIDAFLNNVLVSGRGPGGGT